MMIEDYVSFEIAKLLKEKGFPLPSTNFEDCVFCMYDENGDIQWGCYHPDYYCRVTLQMAMKWLREVRKIFIEIKMSKNTFLWGYRVTISNGRTTCFHTNIFNKYEEACEAAIKYCLKNLI